jgi:hypothetical protein
MRQAACGGNYPVAVTRDAYVTENKQGCGSVSAVCIYATAGSGPVLIGHLSPEVTTGRA